MYHDLLNEYQYLQFFYIKSHMYLQHTAVQCIPKKENNLSVPLLCKL